MERAATRVDTTPDFVKQKRDGPWRKRNAQAACETLGGKSAASIL
jgi:hypothetical protein